MKGPICFEDAKISRLCKICEAKLRAGMITDNDIKAWKELVMLGEKKVFFDLEFLRSVELNGTLSLVCRGDIGALIGKGGQNIKQLEQSLGKKIRIIEKTSDAKQTAQQVLGKTKIISLNKVFKPDSEELKIIVPKQDEKRINEKEQLEKILSKILETKTTIEFQ